MMTQQQLEYSVHQQQWHEEQSVAKTLLTINVNDHVEKKGTGYGKPLSYLSWAWAWQTVLEIDPCAEWQAVCNRDGLPVHVAPDGSAMVRVDVTIKGKTRSCWLPVMDNKNKAIKNPDTFAINTALMRCMVKAIAMHGLGLYIYAGEDIPTGAEQEPTPKVTHSPVPAIEDLAVPEERQHILFDLSETMVAAFKAGDTGAVLEAISDPRTFRDQDEKLFVWNRLKPYPSLRAFIKDQEKKLQSSKVAAA